MDGDFKLRWFKFHPGDFFSSGHVMQMSFTERALYLLLLVHCYHRGGSIPGDLAAIAKMTRGPLKHIRRAWPAIGPCFQPVEGDPTRLTQKRVLEELASIGEKSSKASASAIKRHQAEREGKAAGPLANEPDARALPVGEDTPVVGQAVHAGLASFETIRDGHRRSLP